MSARCAASPAVHRPHADPYEQLVQAHLRFIDPRRRPSVYLYMQEYVRGGIQVVTQTQLDPLTLSKRMRQHIVRMVYEAQSGHIGGSTVRD